MNLFKKLFNPQPPSLKQDWIIAKGIYDGKLILVRFYSDARKIAGNTQFPFRIGIAIPIVDTQDNGMPTSEENKKLFVLEDSINSYFTHPMVGILCIVLTFPKVKEYVIYSSTDIIKVLIERLKKNFPEYEIQFYIKEDKGWDMYRYYDPENQKIDKTFVS